MLFNIILWKVILWGDHALVILLKIIWGVSGCQTLEEHILAGCIWEIILLEDKLWDGILWEVNLS